MDAELASTVSAAFRSSSGMETGRVRELVLTADGITAVARVVGSDFFVSLLLKGDYSLGLAKIEALRIAKEFQDSLI